jgi:hypothetical protein
MSSHSCDNRCLTFKNTKSSRFAGLLTWGFPSLPLLSRLETRPSSKHRTGEGYKNLLQIEDWSWLMGTYRRIVYRDQLSWELGGYKFDRESITPWPPQYWSLKSHLNLYCLLQSAAEEGFNLFIWKTINWMSTCFYNLNQSSKKEKLVMYH